MTTSDNRRETSREIAAFLTDYATKLLECGATTARIEKNVLRMAEAYGCRSEINVFPLHVEIVFYEQQLDDIVVRSKAIRDSNINYNTISELSKLSWNCYDQHLSLDEAKRRFTEVVETTRIPFWVVTVLTALANLSFCRLFDGDLPAMLIVFIATACGFYVKKQLIATWKLDMRAAIIIAGCVSAVMSCSGYVFSLGHTPDVALATSVLYLVPGIPYLNAMSDLINGHYICAMSRLLHACVITVCLAIGLYIGLLMMNTTMMS